MAAGSTPSGPLEPASPVSWRPFAPEAAASNARQILVAVLVGVWSLRLGAYIAFRVAGDAHEDKRYAGFPHRMAAAFQRNMFLLCIVQAPAAMLLSLSIFTASHGGPPELGIRDALGALVLLAGILGEGIADDQMRRFRKTGQHGAVMDKGLWAWSRHPTILRVGSSRLAYPVIVFDTSIPWTWLSLVAPAMCSSSCASAPAAPALRSPCWRAAAISSGDASEARQRLLSAAPEKSPTWLRLRAIIAFEAAPLPDFVRKGLCRSWSSASAATSVTRPPTPRGSLPRTWANTRSPPTRSTPTSSTTKSPPSSSALCLGPKFKYYQLPLRRWLPRSRRPKSARLGKKPGANAQLAERPAHPGTRLRLGLDDAVHGGAPCQRPYHRRVELRQPARAHRGKRRRQGLTNIRIITADMNVFNTDERFDRIVFVEMFEHMSNWRALLERCRVWLKSDGRACSCTSSPTAPRPDRFDVNDPADWVAHHFFAGGVMPSPT